MDDKSRGLYHKYKVERTDGKLVGICLVLELKDPNAWQAMRQYAATVRACGYIVLAKEIEQLINSSMAITLIDRALRDKGTVIEGDNNGL